MISNVAVQRIQATRRIHGTVRLETAFVTPLYVDAYGLGYGFNREEGRRHRMEISRRQSLAASNR